MAVSVLLSTDSMFYGSYAAHDRKSYLRYVLDRLANNCVIALLSTMG
jgi:hypothetical protein